MTKFKTIEQLFKAAICIDSDGKLSTLQKTSDLQNFMKECKRFNTSNGILSFTFNAKTYAIPNFLGVISLLTENGFRQNYLMPVPADNSPEVSCPRWQDLIADYQTQFMDISA